MKMYDVYEARIDGIKLFSATFDELVDIFETMPYRIRRTIEKGAIFQDEYNIVDREHPIKQNKIREYIVYDVKDNDTIAMIGTKDETLKFLNIGDHTFTSALLRGSVIGLKYRVENYEL